MENKVISTEYVKKNFIRKDEIKKELLEPIRSEADIAYKNFMSKKKEENFEVDGAILQELGWIEGVICRLLDEEYEQI